jgi:hypothetical protein
MLGGQPDGFDVLGEGDLAARVVVPGALPDFGLLAVGCPFGCAATGVGAGGGLSAFGVAVAGHEAFVAVVGDADLIHANGCIPRDVKQSKVSMSARRPQTLPRTPANECERQRKLIVGLTCDFTLTMRPSRGECEPLCEADTALITQRSQVQILPPLRISGSEIVDLRA